ncbi:hypothetical protein AB0D08_11680 [Kitasatospora sp. NPDC048540]|uniref:WXG100-like domain-containing protein n=1 Tax=Kitasatospora sp. NPDC048540 TaxID=3155634 RepID=UPI0033F05DC6
MAVELPEPLQWVLLLLAGCRWPEADEDQLRDMADHCRKAAESLKDAAQSSDAAIKRALDGQRGLAAEALGKYWDKFATGKGTQEDPGYLPGAINALDGMGDMLEQMANSAETAKIQIIAQLGILAFEIATAEAEAPFTAGASLLQVPVAIGASRAVVSTLLKTLLKEMITMAAKQAAQMAAINLLAQGIELAEGHRKSIDMKEVGQNALGGAVGGASAHLIGKGIGGAGKKLGAEGALNSTAGKMATGAAVGVGADVSTQLITTGKVDSESLLGSGLSGGAGAGLHAGAAAIKGHANAPKAAELPHLDTPASGSRGIGEDGPPTFSRSATSSGGGSYHGPTGEGGGGGGGSATRSLDGGNGAGNGSGAGTGGGEGLGGGSHAGTDTAAGPGSGSGPGSSGSRVSGLMPFGSARASETPSQVGSTDSGSHPAPATHAAENGSSGGATRSFDPSAQHTGGNEPTAAQEQPLRQTTSAPSHESAAVRPDTAAVASHEPASRQEAGVREPVEQRVGQEAVARQEQPVHEPVTARSADDSVATRSDAAAVASHEPASRQEAVARQEQPVHEPVTARSADDSVATRSDAAAVASHEPASRQEAVARQEQPVHEPVTARSADDSVATRSDAAVVASHEPASRQEAGVREPVEQRVGQDSAPRQEQPVHEPVTARSVHEPASTLPDTAAVVSHEPVMQGSGQESVLRHDPQLSHEPSAGQEPVPHQQVAERGGQESVPRQEQPLNESPVGRGSDEGAPRQEQPVREPVVERTGQEGVPRQEQPPHESAVERGSHEGVSRDERPVESGGPRSAATPVHEQQTVTAGSSAGHTAPPVRETVAEPSDVPSQGSGTGPVPNLSGVLGGAAHAPGAGGNTNLDGGTRISGGHTPTRTEPDQALPGQVVPPDASSSSATQSPNVTPPTAGGFVPGPVAGSGSTGHQGGGRPSSGTHSIPPAPKPPAVRPSTPTGSGGTIRPGTGRGRDGDLTPPPPPPPPPASASAAVKPEHSTSEGNGVTPHTATTTSTSGPVHDHQGGTTEGTIRSTPPTPTTATGHDPVPARQSQERGTTPATNESLPSPAHRAATEVDFPPPGSRVKVAADGLCLLHSVAVSAPDLVGPRTAESGGVARRLQTAVEQHFSELPPERWPTEVVSNYRHHMLGRPELGARELLDHLPADVRDGYAGMPIADLREIVGDHLAHNAPPPSPREREALLRTVRDWENRWLTNEGEMLPAAAAHALGLRMRVVGHDGTPLAVFGPADGRAVTVYHRGNHYDGSEPVASTSTDTHPPAATREGTTAPTPEKSGEKPSAPKDPAPEKSGEKPAAPKDPASPETHEKPAETHEKPPAPPEAEQQPSQQQHTTADPEPQSKPEPEPQPEPQPPHQDAAGPRPIAGTDLVVGLTENEAAVRDKVIAVLEQAVPGDRAAARAFADAHFGPATLRPILSALSRGEVWTAPLEGNGWSGSIKLRGQVTESTHLRTEKIEFENGADRTVATGTGRDAQWQYNIGVQARQSGGGAEPAELAAYFHDRGHGEVNLDLGGMVARSKTAEPAEVYRSTMRLELDFGDLRHDHTPVRTGSGGHAETVDLGMTVAVPVRPEAGAVGEPRTPPQRLQDGRVGGQEIVLDLSPRGASQGNRPVEELLDHVEQAAKQEFGKDWPALREKVLVEVDFGRLQRDLKSMTAGEPVTVALTDRRGRTLGTVEISARVGDLRQTGTTKETEFNIGTSVQQVRSTATTRGNAGQFGLANVLKPGAALMGVGGAGRLGRDRIEIAGDSRSAQLTSKSKVPGVRYEGAVHFEMSFNGKADTHEAGTADVRLLVDRADTTPEAVKADPAAHDTTPPEPQKSPAPETDGTAKSDGTTEAVKTDGTTAPPTHEVTSPPDSVWHGGDDRGGLGETVVVRDLESTAALRAAVDAKGRERFGDDWDAVRDQVLRGFTQPNLAARLTGMTRGEALEVKIPGKESLVVTATARVESMTYRREDGKAELNTVNETGAFSVDRRLLARTGAANGQLGGTVAKGAPGADLLATASGQQRDRVGGQGRQADRVYANGKYSAPQVIYGADLAVDVHFGRPGEAPDGRSAVSAPLRVEVGMDARDTVKVQAPRSEDGTVAFKRPAEPPEPAAPAEGSAPARDDRPAGTRRDGVELDRPAATHTAPRRMREQHELNASYVVHTLSGADKVRTAVEDAVRSKYGEPSDEVTQRIGATFDRVALKTQLSQLTRGGKITETVSGTTWKAEVTVTARLADTTYHSTADKYEFESGTRTSRGQGNLRDRRDRLDAGGRTNIRAPFVTTTGGYAHRMDRSYGHGAETVGSASNRGKHVEPAVFFDVDAAYDVKVTFKRLGVDDGSHTQQVDTVARVAVPMRDADPVSGPVERTTAKQPKGFVEGRRLDSSAIVTDVHALPDARPDAQPAAAHGTAPGTKDDTAHPTAGATPGPRRTLGESIVSQVESGWKSGSSRPATGGPDGRPKPERNPFASDWAGIRRKLDEELTPDRLQSRLKGMTAGDEIVVRHGRTTVRVGAVLRDRMEHLGDSGTTEFNTGTDVQRSFADSNGTGHGHQGVLGATAAVPVPGAPVSVTAGVTGTGGRGQEHADVRTSSTAAGSATKAKLPGSAYRGEAELQFTITRRPWVGASVHQRRTAAIGFETIVESGETVPVPPKSSDDAPTAQRPPRTLPTEAPEQVSVRIPPERVWETGLRDTDVLRWLGDVGGVQDLVRLRGPEFFGRSTWQEMEPMVGTVTSHSHLSAMFGTASQGSEVAASIPTKRVTLGGGKGVEVGVKIVSLEHRDTDAAVELSPANATSSGTVRSDLAAKNAGVQGQVGARITGDVTNNPAITGGAQRLWREGGTHGDSGQIVSNGKFATPMARYHGAAEVEVTLFDGNRNPVKEKGIVPFTVDIPLSETTGVDLPGDHYLAFTEDHKGGELRSGDGARLLEDVHRTLTGGDRPFDHTAATPAEREQLIGTTRVGRAAFGGEFTAGTEAGRAHIQATHRLVELAGGSSAATSALLGDLLNTPDGAALKADDVRKVIDYVERKSAEGSPVILDDLVAGAQDGWPAHEPYDIHRETWTEPGPANELVTAAMASAAAAARPLLQDGLPEIGRLHLTVSGEGAELPLRREFELTGDPAEQIRRIEEATYLKPGTRPSEVSVRLAGAPESGHQWDFRVTARPEGSRELTLRHRRPADDQQPDGQQPDGQGTDGQGSDGQRPDDPVRSAAAASVTAAAAFAAGRSAAPAESA